MGRGGCGGELCTQWGAKVLGAVAAGRERFSDKNVRIRDESAMGPAGAQGPFVHELLALRAGSVSIGERAGVIGLARVERNGLLALALE